MTAPRLLGRVAEQPARCPTVWIPWGKATETLGESGLTALACAALTGPEGFRVGHRRSVIKVDVSPPSGGGGLGVLRRTLAMRRVHRVSDRAWQFERAIHLATWGETCVDDLPAPAAAAAITDEQILRRAGEIADCVRDGGVRESPPDRLDWRGGRYYGVRNQQRLTVGVRVPWPGPLDVGVVASHLGRVGAPGVLVRTLAQRQIPCYAAAATPVREHATTCLGLGLSTTAEHVVALLEAVREVLRTLDPPASRLPFLRASATLHEAICPSSGPFDQPGSEAVPATGPPAVAVMGRLPGQTVAELRAVLHDW